DAPVISTAPCTTSLLLRPRTERAWIGTTIQMRVGRDRYYRRTPRDARRADATAGLPSVDNHARSISETARSAQTRASESCHAAAPQPSAQRNGAFRAATSSPLAGGYTRVVGGTFEGEGTRRGAL